MESDANEFFMENLEKIFSVHDEAALKHIKPLAEMLMDKPNEAIDMIFQKYNQALNGAYTQKDGENCRAFIESVAGGPCEIIPWALYNAVGAVYPYLKRAQKDRALRQILDILDKRNYSEVNGLTGVGHTTGIREPLLLSDIHITRQLYWPGLEEGEELIKRNQYFFEFQKEFIDNNGLFVKGMVKSDFVVAYSLLRSDICAFGEDYIEIASPAFLNRTLKAIVAMRFARAETEEKAERGRRRLQELLPKSVHDKIELLRKERGWVDYRKFP